jgi:hypothetical protein
MKNTLLENNQANMTADTKTYVHMLKHQTNTMLRNNVVIGGNPVIKYEQYADEANIIDDDAGANKPVYKNLLGNPSFEDPLNEPNTGIGGDEGNGWGYSGSEPFSQNWAFFHGYQYYTSLDGFSVSTTESHTGSNSLYMNGADLYDGVYQDVVVKPNTYYKVNFWSNLSTPQFKWGAWYQDGEGRYTLNLCKGGDGPGDNVNGTLAGNGSFQGLGWIHDFDGNPILNDWVWDSNESANFRPGYAEDSHVLYTYDLTSLRIFIQTQTTDLLTYLDDMTMYECDENGELVPEPQYDPNILGNPSFEDPLNEPNTGIGGNEGNGWGYSSSEPFSKNWAFFSGYQYYTSLDGFSVSTTESHTGSNSLLISNATQYDGMYQDVVVKPDTYYKVNFWSNLSTPQFQWGAWYKDAEGRYTVRLYKGGSDPGDTVNGTQVGYGSFQGLGWIHDFDGNPIYNDWVWDSNESANFQLGYANDSHVLYTYDLTSLRIFFQTQSADVLTYLDDITMVECDENGEPVTNPAKLDQG